eukprot:12420897-Prorocentrum_lima.AAC.1
MASCSTRAALLHQLTNVLGFTHRRLLHHFGLKRCEGPSLPFHHSVIDAMNIVDQLTGLLRRQEATTLDTL